MPSTPITYQGDTIRQPFKIQDTDITGYKIRAEFYDKSGNSYQMANAVSGGDDSQIVVTDAVNGEFTVIVAKNQTTKFYSKCFLEVEIEDTSSPTNLYTLWQGIIDLKDQKITWTTPSN
jgi:predicted PP-loop superfamily ATPase